MVVAIACGLVVWRMHREYAQALIAALRAGRFDVFRAGERAFAGFQGDASAIQIAVRALGDPKPSVRRLGAAMLAEMRAASAAPALVKKLRDPEAEVRIAALDALGELGAREAAGPVIALVDDTEASVRVRALRVLPDLQPPLTPELLATLEKHLRDADVQVQAQAAVALIKLDASERAAALLEGLLRHTNPEGRVLGLETLGTASTRRYTRPSGFGRSGSGLKPTVQNDETYRVRLVAAMLEDETPKVRAAACKLLGQLQDESTLGPLSARLDDPDADVRLAAGSALRQFGGRATAYVLPALKSDNSRAQNAALDALQLGDPAAFESMREVVYREAARLREWEQLADALPKTTSDCPALAPGVGETCRREPAAVGEDARRVRAERRAGAGCTGLRARDRRPRRRRRSTGTAG
jgi:HEAT repeat protein